MGEQDIVSALDGCPGFVFLAYHLGAKLNHIARIHIFDFIGGPVKEIRLFDFEPFFRGNRLKIFAFLQPGRDGIGPAFACRAFRRVKLHIQYNLTAQYLAHAGFFIHAFLFILVNEISRGAGDRIGDFTRKQFEKRLQMGCHEFLFRAPAHFAAFRSGQVGIGLGEFGKVFPLACAFHQLRGDFRQGRRKG
ncbi:MAG: hypothetical protein BWX80_03134 [Candidatus Hydrogenedentes bacterium ADurb.Bin101]|nr:MAG: hypothetical protein BWX80_03134 [Candidatus Hydrogenedentes bacterium ADurb.Bin101]